MATTKPTTQASTPNSTVAIAKVPATRPLSLDAAAPRAVPVRLSTTWTPMTTRARTTSGARLFFRAAQP
jgi:hypothetical protein